MEEVIRYRQSSQSYLYLDPNGDWVKFSDYQELKTEATEKITGLKARVEALETALKFYAQSEYYPLAVLEVKHFEIVKDNGEKARKALGKEK